MFKNIAIAEHDFKWIQERKEKTGQSIKYIITLAIAALREKDQKGKK